MIRIKEIVMFVRSIKQLNIDMIQRENKNKNKVPNNRNQRKNREKKLLVEETKNLPTTLLGLEADLDQ